MEGAGPLTLLSIVMFAGSFLSGCIPLAMSMSESKLQNVSIFGAGLLVGTALSVIIPEGVKSLYMVVNASNTISSVTTIAEKVNISENLPSRIGITLLLGFILMLLIDQIFSKHKSKDVESAVSQRTPDITATLGLVVHAAVDGVALGAAATTSEADVEMIVFLAIMLHKAPAAFALVTFLMHEGVDRRRIRHHLLVFSSAAPLFALLTFFGISQESKETLTTFKATGTAMLFSAGTFLYVATVHVLPELSTNAGGSLKPHQVVYLVIGTLAPLLLTLFH